MRLNGLTPYLILVALGALLITSLACDQIAGYDRATYGPLASGYYCQAEIFRGLDPQHAFVEQWLATVYPKALETGDGLCRLRLQQYIAKAMSPYFYWETRNVTSIPLVEGQKAVDCAPQDPGNGDPIPDPTGPNEIPPASYGGPLGALVTWFPPNDGDGFVPENLASVTLTLKNSDGTVKETATPRVKYAGLVIAERQGALNGLLTDAQYDPTKRHLRVSDFVIQLESPFDFAGLHVNNLYIKNVGTLLSESGMGPNRYVFLTEPLRSASPVPSKAKFYFHAIGESDGHSALDSRCFVNSDSTLGGTSDAITFTQEPSGPIFSLAFNIQDVGDAPLDIQIKLISPADTLFTQHQPWVSIPDIETSETQVDLSVIKENGELRVYDHDGIASPKIQWFEDFEQPGERFIGEGLEIPNVPFSPGAHRVTVVVFDENGTYNYDTFTVNVAAPPEASNDGYETDEDVILNISAPGVLGNDTDSNGDLLSAILVSRPSHGDVDLSEDGSFTYTPAENFNGSDSFTYKANDGSQDSNVATVTITVNPVNDPPVAIDDAYSTDEDTALTLGAPGVLGNDQDVEGDPLTAVPGSGPSHGTLSLDPNGSFTYKPTPNFFGTDSFKYRANDGAADSDPATVTITVNELSAQQETDRLAEKVKELRAAGAINGGQENSLLQKLDAIGAKLDVEKTVTVCNLYGAFIQNVASLVADGVLSPEQGQPLIDAANNLREELGCK